MIQVPLEGADGKAGVRVSDQLTKRGPRTRISSAYTGNQVQSPAL